MAYIIQPTELTKDEYENEFYSILENLENQEDTDVKEFIKKEEPWTYDGWYENPQSFYKAHEIFELRFGKTFAIAMGREQVKVN